MEPCAICRVTQSLGVLTPCGHGFHTACMARWTAKSKTCPTCRRQVPRVQEAAPWEEPCPELPTRDMIAALQAQLKRTLRLRSTLQKINLGVTYITPRGYSFGAQELPHWPQDALLSNIVLDGPLEGDVPLMRLESSKVFYPTPKRYGKQYQPAPPAPVRLVPVQKPRAEPKPPRFEQRRGR